MGSLGPLTYPYDKSEKFWIQGDQADQWWKPKYAQMKAIDQYIKAKTIEKFIANVNGAKYIFRVFHHCINDRPGYTIQRWRGPYRNGPYRMILLSKNQPGMKHTGAPDQAKFY
jgi:hypothetical protein